MNTKRNYSEITPQIEKMTQLARGNNYIKPELYLQHKVNRGLRDLNGKGVLTGLTEISEIQAKEVVDGKEVSSPGMLFYRGYNIKDLVGGVIHGKRYNFEEISYLLLLGELPTASQLDEFIKTLATYRSLPSSFTRDVIMKAPSENMMNSLARSVLTLYSYDYNPEDTSMENVMRQSMQLIGMFPLLSIYGYQVYDYYHKQNGNLVIRDADPNLSTAENILYMLRPNGKFTPLEAQVLDVCLILHAEHGGGNNSSFTTHVVTSSGTDTYSAIAAALGSLKGPKHGGANLKVCHMFDDIKENVRDWQDDDEISAYLEKLLNKEAFDKSGLIYGIGHAVYSVSDPRAEVLKGFVEKLSEEKNLTDVYGLYANVERLAPKVISSEKKMYKGVSANVDFYSGLVYQMLGIPVELFTPLFAIARITGWSAHRMEELINCGKIIRPAYMAVGERKEYIPLEKR